MRLLQCLYNGLRFRTTRDIWFAGRMMPNGWSHWKRYHSRWRERRRRAGWQHCTSVFIGPSRTPCVRLSQTSLHQLVRDTAENHYGEFSSVSIHVCGRPIDYFISTILFLRVSTSITGAAIRPSGLHRSPRMCICCCWSRYVRRSPRCNVLRSSSTYHIIIITFFPHEFTVVPLLGPSHPFPFQQGRVETSLHVPHQSPADIDERHLQVHDQDCWREAHCRRRRHHRRRQEIVQSAQAHRTYYLASVAVAWPFNNSCLPTGLCITCDIRSQSSYLKGWWWNSHFWSTRIESPNWQKHSLVTRWVLVQYY